MNAKQDHLNIGIIGAGRIGLVHASNLIKLKNVSLTAIADVNIESAKKAAKLYKITKVYENHQDLIQDPDIHAVLICSSTDTHAKFIEDCSAAKKHVFCEKPIDLEVAKVKRAIKAAEKAGIILQIGFNRRFDPNFKNVSDLVRTEQLGEAHLVRITSRDPQPPPPEYVGVSGGIFLDMTIHDFDMARFLLNDEVQEVFSTGAVLIDPLIGKNGDVDTAVTVLKFKKGAICTIDNSRKASYGYDQRIEVFGSRACAVVSNTAPTNTSVWSEKGQQQGQPHYFFLEKYQEAFLIEIKEFVTCILDKKVPSVGGIDGLNALLIGLAAKKSLAERRLVQMSEIES